MRSFFLQPILAILLALPAMAHEITHGPLQIIHPTIPAPRPGAKAAAGYMAISNNGDSAEYLLAIEPSFADAAEVHKSEMQDGIARMVPVGVLEIPADDTVVLEPGGLHVMFFDPKGPFEPGEELPVTLIFENEGPVPVGFLVGAYGESHEGH